MNYPLVNGISDFIWQLLTGHSPKLNTSMWFQMDLIVITILFFIIFHFLNENAGFVLIIVLSLFCLFLQYSGINWMLFGSLRFELKYPLGRLSETIPVATLGFIASKYNLLEIKKENKWVNMMLAAIMFMVFLILDIKVFVPLTGFGYAGIWKNCVAFAITMFAFNFGKIFKKQYKSLNFVTSYTLGVYCGHQLVGFFLHNVLSKVFGVDIGFFYQCIIIYIICFIASFLVSKIHLQQIKYIV